MKADPRTKNVIIVVTTVGTEEQALDIAHHLVSERLVACVNILPRIRSVFRWKGKINDDGEFLLFAKTVEANFEAVRLEIRRLHAYELPEILGFPAVHFDEAFAKWVVEASRPRKRKKAAGSEELRGLAHRARHPG